MASDTTIRPPPEKEPDDLQKHFEELARRFNTTVDYQRRRFAFFRDHDPVDEKGRLLPFPSRD